jgi:uncharacterized membrane protein (UPF0127 family)
MRRLALAATLALLSGCGGDSENADVILEGSGRALTVTVEIADSLEERRRGLSNRDELAADSGMLFLFERPVTQVFWMKDTTIPLSIAFVGTDERIVAIRDMEPCRADPCPTYAAGEPFSAALEVNRGAFRRWGIDVGDRMRIGS